MKDILWISIGAIVGANLRYFIGRWTGHLFPHPFPLGTFLINVSGSFLLGMFFVWARQRAGGIDPNLRLLIAVGFCGGYTTFSSYAWESFDLLRQGSIGLFALNVIGSNLCALLAVFAGAALAQRL